MDGLARRWGCAPSVVLREPAWVLRVAQIAAMAEAEEPGGGEQQWP